ncbi:hypothetical protein WME79_28470 [Sorangium sp. So ce726]|uniref:hypothetical protein n=1 Tax=Sorangium sp. So ce726 TaxID=3133319 RepID=UPI003F5DDFCC
MRPPRPPQPRSGWATSSKGIDAKQLAARGDGPDRPIDDNKRALARQKNRRVEFIIVHSLKKPQHAPATPAGPAPSPAAAPPPASPAAQAPPAASPAAPRPLSPAPPMP